MNSLRVLRNRRLLALKSVEKIRHQTKCFTSNVQLKQQRETNQNEHANSNKSETKKPKDTSLGALGWASMGAVFYALQKLGNHFLKEENEEKPTEPTPHQYALMDCITTGNEDKVKEILVSNKLNPNFSFKCRRGYTTTPLNFAIHRCLQDSSFPISIVEMLLESGADVNYPGDEPLFELARYSFLDSKHTRTIQILDMLMANKPDYMRKEYKEKNLLQLSWSDDVLIYLVEALNHLCPEQLQKLMEERSSTGETVLHSVAGSKGSAFTYLLKKGKHDLSLRDEDGNTVLHAACHRLSPENVKAILDLCKDKDYINLKNSEGCTPLAVAARASQDYQQSKRTVIMLLLERGADPTILSNGGEPALSQKLQQTLA